MCLLSVQLWLVTQLQTPIVTGPLTGSDWEVVYSSVALCMVPVVKCCNDSMC